MDDYISRKAAIIGLAASSLMPHQIDDAAEALRLVPAADVRPVVTCGECKYWRGPNDLCTGICIDFDADGFCAYGERRAE